MTICRGRPVEMYPCESALLQALVIRGQCAEGLCRAAYTPHIKHCRAAPHTHMSNTALQTSPKYSISNAFGAVNLILNMQ